MTKVGPVTCAGCGLLCDDVTLEVSGDAVRLEPQCPLGAEWFTQRVRRPADAPIATIDGEPAELEPALARAAELLRGARRPLVHGFEHATMEDARAAVALADRLGAAIVTGSVAGSWRGASTATLGEIRDRSRVVVIWREDPETTHPRLLERLGLDDRSEPDRVLAVIDDRDTATAGRADVRLTWTNERDLEALTSLHVLQRGLPLDDPPAGLHDLMERLGSVTHATFVYGEGLTGGAGGQRRALALHELVRALSGEGHVVTLELPRAPGTRTANDVLAWQSGYGGRVDFASGHPEVAIYPLDDADVTLLVEPAPAGGLVAGPVWIRTAAAGVSAGGTAHRLDGVPLTLQAPQPDDTPSAAALLTRLLAEIER